jgi:hypothetical protein
MAVSVPRTPTLSPWLCQGVSSGAAGAAVAFVRDVLPFHLSSSLAASVEPWLSLVAG